MIDGLQESLRATCKQIDEERDRHRRELHDVQSAASSREQSMAAELVRLRHQIFTVQSGDSDTEVTRPFKLAKDNFRLAFDVDDTNVYAQPAQVCDNDAQGSKPNRPTTLSLQRLGSKGSLQKQPSTDGSSAQQARFTVPECIDDSDSDERTLASAEIATNLKKASPRNTSGEDPGAGCAGCHGKSFGFMIRCHKCQENFHIGCAKSTQPPTNGKRKLRHSFQCKTCTPTLPQRPAKVPCKAISTAGA